MSMTRCVQILTLVSCKHELCMVVFGPLVPFKLRKLDRKFRTEDFCTIIAFYFISQARNKLWS